MSPVFRRVLRVGVAASVAVLVLVCAGLVHHEGAAAQASEPTAHVTQAAPGAAGHESPARRDAPDDRCSLVELVACASTNGGTLVTLGLSALALLSVGARRRPLLQAHRLAVGAGAPRSRTAPLLSALCISRT